MRIYLDNCCYNRPYDNTPTKRIQAEVSVILKVLLESKDNGDIIVGSHILKFEIDKITDENKKTNVKNLYTNSVRESVKTINEVVNVAQKIVNESSIHEMDALHLASAIVGNADIFLTVDDKLIKACKNLDLKMQVINPVEFER